ncbi:AraC family transcriptional regulator [Salmonella enterica]|nr:AraC family transcriptional regulator [Salmonella enterica]EEK3466748.1 AraC family transcriptional regulator [Salmonella enterica subsp. enterica]EEK3657530.1 AraC family transcriptional regulator [Salmonella enterica subsp. enterica]EEK4245405.1 AraC family transcriptional regulator [Salmonella enterica subsp. enterica]EEL0412548.1 AraC family transcriptional regulator [Salmonella enterica]EEO4663607.1 AraC family transcriptional regulator [Salmonella enterica subsp. enterica]
MYFTNVVPSCEKQKTEGIAVEDYHVYASVVIFTGGNEVRLKNRRSGQDNIIDKNSIFLLVKNECYDITVTHKSGDYDMKIMSIPDKYISLISETCSFFDDISDVQTSNDVIMNEVASEDLCLFYQIINKFNDRKPEDQNTSIFDISYVLSFFRDDIRVISALKHCKIETTASRVIKIMEENLSKNWKINEVSEQMFITESCLRKKLQKENLSFRKLSVDVKMKHASIYLRRYNKNISQIAHILGFNSTSYFIKVFRDYYNTTPKKYVKFFRN